MNGQNGSTTLIKGRPAKKCPVFDPSLCLKPPARISLDLLVTFATFGAKKARVSLDKCTSELLLALGSFEDWYNMVRKSAAGPLVTLKMFVFMVSLEAYPSHCRFQSDQEFNSLD
jgi:hypothetical protein